MDITTLTRRSKPLKSLADKAFHILEEMIVTLELTPGELISEAELSQKIEIGRTPLREALQRLAQERLVTVLPRRGMIVSEVNLMDHLEVVALRRVIDSFMAANSIKRVTEEQCDRLKELADSIEEAASQDDIQRFIQLDGEFDHIMQVASRNFFGAQISETIHSHCRRFWFINQTAGDLMRSANLHAQMMRAIANKNKEEASQASDLLSDYVEEFTRSSIDH